MTKKLTIITKEKSSSIDINYGIFNNFLKSIIKLNVKKYIIIDEYIYKKYNSFFLNFKDFNIIRLDGSEKIKSEKYYFKIVSLLLKKQVDRKSMIIAIGGGSIGDLCGFIASTVLRGVKLTLIPTTLLSQVDSSIGGKNGINSKHGKNLIGTFYQPDKIIIDPLFLQSLPIKQIRSGYAEIIKYAIINDEKFYQWLKKNYAYIYKLKKDIIIKTIEKSIKIKINFIKKDLKENLENSSSRAILNFGHTFGHALESINNYNSNLTHGEAISIGMVLAAHISFKMKNISKKELYDIINHFKKAKLPIFSNNIKSKKFYKVILNDKKNIGNKVNLILLKKIGKAYYAKNFNIEQIRDMICDI